MLLLHCGQFVLRDAIEAMDLWMVGFSSRQEEDCFVIPWYFSVIHNLSPLIILIL